MSGKERRLWDPEKAKKVLGEELRRRSSGPGMSDSTLARLAHLADPGASATRRSFETVLIRSGMTQRRAQRVSLAVRERSRPLRVRVLRIVRRLPSLWWVGVPALLVGCAVQSGALCVVAVVLIAVDDLRS